MQKSQARERADEAAGRDALLFDIAPVSMWIEDASALLALFKEWSAQGVTSFHDHILAHPALRLECSLALRVIQVNAKTLAQYEATDLAHLIACLPLTFGPEASSEAYARSLFDHSPSALRVEDCSQVSRRFEALRDEGVADMALFMTQEPHFLQECIAAVRIVDVNRRTLELYRCADLPEYVRHIDRMMGEEGRQSERLHFIKLWQGEIEQRSEIVNHTSDGALLHLKRAFSIFPGHEADWSLAMVSLDDITESKLAAERLRYLGTHDALTGLYNRSFYAQMLGSVDTDTQPLTIVSLDLNGLRRVNDRFGHAAGDALIQRAARVLTDSMSDVFYAVRTGGDEFVVLMPGADAPAGARLVAQVERQLHVDNQRHPDVTLSLSVGVATRERDEDVIDVVHRADAEMYVAKREYYRITGFERRTSY